MRPGIEHDEFIGQPVQGPERFAGIGRVEHLRGGAVGDEFHLPRPASGHVGHKSRAVDDHPVRVVVEETFQPAG